MRVKELYTAARLHIKHRVSMGVLKRLIKQTEHISLRTIDWVSRAKNNH